MKATMVGTPATASTVQKFGNNRAVSNGRDVYVHCTIAYRDPASPEAPHNTKMQISAGLQHQQN
jgi:hypothetical protein